MIFLLFLMLMTYRMIHCYKKSNLQSKQNLFCSFYFKNIFCRPPITNNIYKELESELSNVAPLLQKQDSKMSEIETQMSDLFQEIMRPFKNFDVDDNKEWSMDYLFQKHIKAANSNKM